MKLVETDQQVIDTAKALKEGRAQQIETEQKTKQAEEYFKKRTKVNMNNSTMKDKQGVLIK